VSDQYYLKIGGTEIFSEQSISDLSSADIDTKKKAESNLAERLKETRVRVGTLLKTDNVSFLIGAGASMNAGGIGLALIPYELEKLLHAKVEEPNNTQDTNWFSLFYETASALSGQTFNPAERREALARGLTDVPKIPINLEDYLSHLHMWRAGMNEFAVLTTFNLAQGRTLVMSKIGIDRLICAGYFVRNPTIWIFIFRPRRQRAVFIALTVHSIFTNFMVQSHGIVALRIGKTLTGSMQLFTKRRPRTIF